MALGTAHNSLNPGDKLATIKGLGQKVVGTEAEAFDLGIELCKTGENQDRRTHTRCPKPAKHLVAIDVRQHQIKEDDVVIIELTDLQPVFPKIGGVTNKVLFHQHHFDAGGCCRIILDQKHAHENLRIRAGTLHRRELVNQNYQNRLTSGYQYSTAFV